MAGVMNEPTPLKSTFCAILKEEQYEEQTLNSTDEALKDLNTYLGKKSRQTMLMLRRKRRKRKQKSPD